MEKQIIGCWICDFDKILLTNCNNRNLIWIYKWTHSQLAQSRRVRRFPLNPTQVDSLGVLTTRTPNLATGPIGPGPGPNWQSGTVANTNQGVKFGSDVQRAQFYNYRYCLGQEPESANWLRVDLVALERRSRGWVLGQDEERKSFLDRQLYLISGYVVLSIGIKHPVTLHWR